jgi:hypothetical protein
MSKSVENDNTSNSFEANAKKIYRFFLRVLDVPDSSNQEKNSQSLDSESRPHELQQRVERYKRLYDLLNLSKSKKIPQEMDFEFQLTNMAQRNPELAKFVCDHFTINKLVSEFNFSVHTATLFINYCELHKAD